MEKMVLFLSKTGKKRIFFFYYGITGRVFFIPKRQFPHSVALRTLSESPGPSVEAVPI